MRRSIRDQHDDLGCFIPPIESQQFVEGSGYRLGQVASTFCFQLTQILLKFSNIVTEPWAPQRRSNLFAILQNPTDFAAPFGRAYYGRLLTCSDVVEIPV
jgi:hypothetical protein